MVLSVVAACLAAGLSLIGDVSQWSLAATVAVGSFIASWIQSGRFEHAQVARVPVRAAR